MNKRGQAGLLIAVVVLLVIILIVIAVLYFNGSLTGNIVYNSGSTSGSGNNNQQQNTQCRYVTVPYQDTENYVDSVPVLDNSGRIRYRVVDTDEYDCSRSGEDRKCFTVSVRNIDDGDGVFRVECVADTSRRDRRDSVTEFIHSGNTEDFDCQVDLDSDEEVRRWRYDVIPPFVTDVEYREVVRTRTVTKYRQEYRCD